MSGRTSSDSCHLSEALYDAFTLRASKSFLGLRTGTTIHDPISQVAKSVFEFKTFQQVRDDALGAATCMALDLKTERRQFFGICCGNCYDWLLFEYACCFNDQPLVGINTNWSTDVLAQVINLSEIVCIACSADVVPVFQSLKPSCPSLLSLVVINSDPLKPIPACSPQHPLNVFVWNASLRRLHLHHSPLRSAPPPPDCRHDAVCTLTGVGMPDFALRKLRGQLPALDQADIHSLMFTSGTSGAPKGVIITKNRWYMDNKDGGVMRNHTDPAFLSYNSWSHGADRGAPPPPLLPPALFALLLVFAVTCDLYVCSLVFLVTSPLQATFG
jgi:acyl-CoA synthetase (AMP-forming)/AMP-acid ligase II